MQTPGVGFPGIAALIALILYLVPYYLNGLAQNWEIIALLVGFILIALEVFVIPGFGVAGFSGITITIGSLVLIMINNNAFDFEFVPMNDILIALATAMSGILGGIILLFVGSARLANTKFYKRIALTDTQERADGYTSNVNTESLNGKRGLAQTVLRPSGKITIEGHQYDAFTRGEFIDKGKPIEVINEAGSSLQVKQIDT